ncbi:MAG: SCO family protein [Pseudomonadota bacterium]
MSIALSTPAASADADPLRAAVAALGNINGRALACGHTEVVSRAKAIVIARVAKTRELGEAFEQATSAAFLAQGQQKTACPPRAVLAVELEVAARPLNPPNAHQLAATPETPEVGINPRYLLQAANGRAVMDGDFKDRFQLITFGYTYCPDICPTTLLEMAAVLKQLGDDAAKVQALFISVDPERDTLALLRTYTEFFDARILGATGSPELVKRAADNFKVRYERVIDPRLNPAHYAVDHSAGMYLLSPGGQFLTKFPYGKPVGEIVARLREEIARRAPADGAPMQGVAK